ncbi:unnamed protein product, partial [Ectocarpus sp. 8 AP-2014]
LRRPRGCRRGVPSRSTACSCVLFLRWLCCGGRWPGPLLIATDFVIAARDGRALSTATADGGTTPPGSPGRATGARLRHNGTGSGLAVGIRVAGIVVCHDRVVKARLHLLVAALIRQNRRFQVYAYLLRGRFAATTGGPVLPQPTMTIIIIFFDHLLFTIAAATGADDGRRPLDRRRRRGFGRPPGEAAAPVRIPRRGQRQRRPRSQGGVSNL